jgi:hypothetical protein
LKTGTGRSAGRDYDSILKTELGLIIIDGDKETARKRLQQIINVPQKMY